MAVDPLIGLRDVSKYHGQQLHFLHDISLTGHREVVAVGPCGPGAHRPARPSPTGDSSMRAGSSHRISTTMCRPSLWRW